jgi:hypothetical protein
VTAARSDGWLVVARDQRLVLYACASVVVTLGGFGALEADFSLFVVNNLHPSILVIGSFFFANTMTIVLAQLVVVNLTNQRCRTRVLGLGRSPGLSSG